MTYPPTDEGKSLVEAFVTANPWASMPDIIQHTLDNGLDRPTGRACLRSLVQDKTLEKRRSEAVVGRYGRLAQEYKLA